ncbi:MAG TPA: FkbM family methyltransferase [Mycobacterium sp.]|nr:FkbM family methyltransferase [Mycobacterium sp.]HTX95503.1 FkbM family methyltransferase [Mycobacterium sp.]
MTALDDAAAALAANDMARVEAIAGEILGTQPAHPAALQLLAAALFAQGRAAEALAVYQSAVEWLHGNLAVTQTPFGLHVLQRLGLRPRGILDIGAFEGAFAQIARHFFAQSPILMLEAQPGKDANLKAIAGQLPQVDYRIVLLGAENRSDVAFHRVNPAINSSGSSLYEEQTSYPRDMLSLPMRRLDDVLAEMPGREFDLLKIDVQGAELDVLRGGPRTLAGIEAIFMELSLLEYNKGAPLIGEAINWLGEQGFALFDMFPLARTPQGALLQVDGIFLRRDSDLWPQAPFF